MLVLLSQFSAVAIADPPALPSAADATRVETSKPPVRVTISKETTWITGPLREDGYPDYVRYFNEKMSRGVTPENNAAVLLWQAIGPADIEAEHRNDFFKALGVESLPESRPYLVTWESFYEQLPRAKRQLSAQANVDLSDEVWKRQERAQEEPWTSRRDPELAAWLKANEKPLQRMVEASHRTRYFSPLIEAGEPPLIVALLPHINSARLVATALSTRAMMHLGEGRADRAWEDVMAIYRIARHVGSGPTSVEGLVRIAVEGIAGRAAIRILQLGKFNSDQLAKIEADLTTLPPAAKMRDKLDVSERLCFLDAVCSVARNGVRSFRAITNLSSDQYRPQNAVDWIGAVLIDWDVSLRAGNDWFDRLAAALDAPTRQERNQRLAKFDEVVNELPAKFKERPPLFAILFSPRQLISEKISQVFSALLLPALTAVVHVEDRGATAFTLVELAVVLERYRLDHRRYPERLADLSPKYVTTIPNDMIADRPLLYKRTKTGYLRYSLGKNGRDDGGKSADDLINEADDVAIATPAANE